MLGRFGVTELLLIAVIVLVLFGGKRLRTLGGDLGAMLSSFRRAMNPSDEQDQSGEQLEHKK